MTVIVNLMGTPGAGKSTGCAYIFSKLKLAGVNVELITEFAKDKVWEKNQTALDDQLYIFGKQHYKIQRCIGKVDVIVTDSPLIHSVLYNNDKVLGEEFNNLVIKVFKSYNNMNYLINRTKPYNPIGRYQTETQADALKSSIMNILNKYNIKIREKNGDLQSYDEIVNETLYVLNLIKQKNSKQNKTNFESKTDSIQQF